MKIIRFVVLLVGLSAAAFAADKPLFKLTVQLDWVPEPEHGGFYQAQALGFFKAEGLDVFADNWDPAKGQFLSLIHI